MIFFFIDIFRIIHPKRMILLVPYQINYVKF